MYGRSKKVCAETSHFMSLIKNDRDGLL